VSPVTETHIRLDDNGVAWVDDTNVKVVEVAREKLAHGFSPEEMVYQHYGNLTLAQVHAALAYYYDHQAAFDTQIEQELKEYERRAKAADTPGRERLRSLGLRP
jgi:uncharacterized protein (DUF433 family)